MNDTRKTVVPEILAPNEVIENRQVNDLIERDEFASADFIDPNAKLPRIQPLRGTTPQTCGYFISIEEMAKAGWFDYDESQLIDYIYESSGNVEQGILIPNPRMLVCPKSPLLAFDREKTKEEEQIVILGNYQRSYKEDENIGNIQYYEVILLDDNNQPLHQVPFSYAAKGANGASFSILWKQFVSDLTNCHAITNRIAARPKDNRFNSLCVFSFQTKRDLVGNGKQKSFACRVVGYDKPTMQNWKDYFVGFNRTLKEVTWQTLQPTAPLMIPAAIGQPNLLSESNNNIPSVLPQNVKSNLTEDDMKVDNLAF